MDIEELFAERKRLEERVEELRAEEGRAASERRNITAVMDDITRQIIDAMSADGVVGAELKLGNRVARLTVAKGAQRVVIDDEAAIPTDFVVYAPSIDKAGVKAALAGGEVVLGARLERGPDALRVTWRD